MAIPLVPADTTLEAARVQSAVFRRMSGSRRLELALQMSDSLRHMVAAGVRSRHPEYSEAQVKFALIRLTLGDRLFRQVYPGVEIAV
jgi:hypothetical protein